MELRYCEQCGDILQLDPSSGQGDDLECYVCPKCAPARAGGQETAPRQAAREVASNLPTSDDLELFSEQSIALRRSGGTLEPAKASGSKPSGSFVKPPTLAEMIDSDGVDLQKVGTETDDFERWAAAVQPNPGASSASAAGPSAVATAEAPPPTVGTRAEPAPPVGHGTTVGSELPSPKAQKILFRCPHCKSALSIRPVKSNSRLVCPSCEESVYVTVSGQLFKTPPSQRTFRAAVGSVAVRRGSANVARPEAPAKDLLAAALKSSNPLDEELAKVEDEAHAHPRPSAFDEHREREDPEKTLFITEERTTDLRDLELPLDPPSRKTRAGTARALESAKALDSGSVESLDDGDLPFELHLDESDSHADTTAAPRARARQRRAREQTGRKPVGAGGLVLRACALASLLSLPFLVIGALHASAEGVAPTTVFATDAPKELGRVARRGLARALEYLGIELGGPAAPDSGGA